MDNQQESSKDIAWLCGIIDGEGTITLRFHRRKNKTPVIQPVINIVNTNEKIINNIIRILKSLEVPFWVSEYKRTENWKTRWVIEVSGIKRAKKLIPLIENDLVGKKENIELMKLWCEKRYNELGKRSYYTDWDLEIVKQIKLLHTHQDQVQKSFEILRDYTPNTEM
jgi:hypothetical protein